jgi:hypothetical protein
MTIGEAGGMTWRRDLGHLCRALGGPVHVGVAAQRLDVPPRRIRDMASREGWRRPYADVIAPPGTPDTARTRAAAALAQVRGPDITAPRVCALGRWSGAALLGVGPGAPSRVQVLVPDSRRPRSRGGPETIRCRGFGPEAIMTYDGLLVARPAWLVRSAAAVAEVPLLTDLVIDLVQRRQLDLAALRAEHDRWGGYPGRGRVGDVLARLESAGRTDASIELVTRERLGRDGVALDRGQVAVPCADGVTVHLDLGIAVIRFGIELDSMLAHSTREQLRADVRRSNSLASARDDWRIVRATWEDIDRGWPQFLARVRRTIAEQSQRHLGLPWPRPEDLVRQ